ncbi:GGDEF domain-containing protein [Ruminococcus sp.]|uniref:GGDEF domain-containing protein n=1 Tax=Ruminococcus sp. TaxID=41978 RepID=UPI0025E3D278|nr:GGDEF domain-containing protein [Ruminococcus sp.]MCR4639424.1 GGDEF domain-containing protein [Ruminococcus sp.]
MDFRGYLDSCDSVTCIMSVEKKPGGYGNIRILDGNKAYIESIENNPDANSDVAKEKVFVPNSLYTKYFPHDLNFEDFCYRSAVRKEVLHTYVHPGRFDIWFNLFFMPLQSDDENIGYCSYTYTVTVNADSELMSNISLATASAVLQSCIKLYGATDFKKSIDGVVMDIRDLCKANRCCLLLTDFEAETCKLLSDSHIIEGEFGPIEGIIDDSFFEIVKTWPDTIDGSDFLMIKNHQDMEVLKSRNKLWYESLKVYDVKTLVLFPLVYNGDTKGYIWVTDFDVENALKIRETLELTTYFIAYAIANYQLLNQLEIMSSVDLLTGIYNRNAMNHRVDRYIAGTESTPEKYGIVFADLNGLKQVNDSGGHIEGDKLLKNAAEILRGLFYDSDIYRAGGDEFMIMAVNVPEEELEKRMEKLRRDSEDPKNISFAVGGYFEAEGGDIRFAMRTADERMYADKKRYYKKFPERKRK